MEVIIPAHSGFCPGVKSAERKVFEEKRARPGRTLYVNGFLINNKNFIAFLEANGVRTVEAMEDVPDGSVVFIRTHGLHREEEAALRKKYEVVDLTCAHVKKVQEEIARRSREGYDTVIAGTKDHPETKGLVSYSTGRCHVLENPADLKAYARTMDTSRRVFLCSQTTGSRAFFEEVRRSLEVLYGPDQRARLCVFDPICPVTEKKEDEALRLQKETDVSFVIGDRLSANANKLYKRLSADKREVHFIEDRRELEALGLPLTRYRRALVVSSASTPGFIEKDVVDFLSSIETMSSR